MEQAPCFVSYIMARDGNSFIVCADRSLHLFGVSPVVEADHANNFNRNLLQISYLRSIEVSKKALAKCCQVDTNMIVTCSRETIIRVHDL